MLQKIFNFLNRSYPLIDVRRSGKWTICLLQGTARACDEELTSNRDDRDPICLAKFGFKLFCQLLCGSKIFRERKRGGTASRHQRCGRAIFAKESLEQ